MSQESPLVSVVVPAYNAEKWIGHTIASAVAQSYRHLEIIVVNDGSTDRTAVIVEDAAIHDCRIRFFSNPNRGLSLTRNFGIDRARGDLIAPLDADDLWHPDKIARQVEVLQSSPPEVGLVYCWVVEIDEGDFIIPPVRKGPIAAGNVMAAVVASAGMITSGSNPLVRRSYLAAVGGYDPNFQFCEDWKLQLSFAEICQFAVVPAHLVGYRRTAGSVSKNVAGMARSMELIGRWILERWPDMPREIGQQMIYHRGGYLAHLSLTTDQLADAVHYKLEALKARPQALLSRETVEFGIRLLARLGGLRRRSLPRRKLIAFKDFADAETESTLRRRQQAA